jgi:hypothetical protein
MANTQVRCQCSRQKYDPSVEVDDPYVHNAISSISVLQYPRTRNR